MLFTRLTTSNVYMVGHFPHYSGDLYRKFRFTVHVKILGPTKNDHYRQVTTIDMCSLQTGNFYRHIPTTDRYTL